MQAIERTLQERQRFVKSKLASEGVPPTPPQLVAFLRGLVDMIRPHTGRIPPPAAELLRECFLMVSWDVVTNSPVAGSAPCTAGQLVNFLETTSKRLRMGVVTAGWRDQAPPTKQPVQEAAESQSSAPTAAAPEPAPTPVPDPAPTPSPEPAALSAATAATAVGTEEAHAGEDDDASRAAASKAKQDQQQPSQQQQPPLQDEDLFYMDEAEAIRQIEKEIEEQIERNHYKALGI